MVSPSSVVFSSTMTLLSRTSSLRTRSTKPVTSTTLSLYLVSAPSELAWYCSNNPTALAVTAGPSRISFSSCTRCVLGILDEISHRSEPGERMSNPIRLTAVPAIGRPEPVVCPDRATKNPMTPSNRPMTTKGRLRTLTQGSKANGSPMIPRTREMMPRTLTPFETGGTEAMPIPTSLLESPGSIAVDLTCRARHLSSTVPLAGARTKAISSMFLTRPAW